MSTVLEVGLGERAYSICIEEGLIDRIGSACGARGLDARCLVVSDAHVDPLYGARVEDSLKSAGIRPLRHVFEAGEASKNREVLFGTLDAALDQALDRQCFFVALGGGVVGDLAGFAAAVYLRGVRYVQAPTSLLAMVDSSVGGKTGIDVPQGKNLVGAFYQPAVVLIDPAALDTLPPREFAAGMAEVIKYGIIHDAAFFARLEASVDRLRPAEREQMIEIIARCCEIKADVVRRDERESTGARAILNFGHTLAHAIECTAGYGALLHGEAVGIGMRYAARLSHRLCGLPIGEVERIDRLIDAVGLPSHPGDLEWDEIRRAMCSDKKARDGLPLFVLADAIGHVEAGYAVEDEMLREVWDECCQ